MAPTSEIAPAEGSDYGVNSPSRLSLSRNKAPNARGTQRETTSLELGFSSLQQDRIPQQ
jgi:hypothetical protein